MELTELWIWNCSWINEWVVYLKCKRLAKKKSKKDGVSQVVDLKLTKHIKGKSIKKYGGWMKLCNDKRFTKRMNEKKDGIDRIMDLKLQLYEWKNEWMNEWMKKNGVDWIVDLKLTKKWKGKWEKKMGFAELWIWNK